ncbi:hypothetical protein CUMW_037650 [Citrus unshiu]|nr:hypothetical protein CUMW_037650 [Citrus unshiu]
MEMKSMRNLTIAVEFCWLRMEFEGWLANLDESIMGYERWLQIHQSVKPRFECVLTIAFDLITARDLSLGKKCCSANTRTKRRAGAADSCELASGVTILYSSKIMEHNATVSSTKLVDGDCRMINMYHVNLAKPHPGSEAVGMQLHHESYTIKPKLRIRSVAWNFCAIGEKI